MGCNQLKTVRNTSSRRKPVVREAPVVDTAPASVEDPVDPEPLDFQVYQKMN